MQESRMLEVKLTDFEVLCFAREQAKKQVEMKKLEADRKEINDEIKPLRDRISYLAPVIDSGIEIQEVDCEWEFAWDRDVKSLRRMDTDEIVGDTVKIPEHERQRYLGDEEK